jgi:hypothetical protein
LLIALFEEYDAGQTEALESALADLDVSLAAYARAIATSHVDCVLGHGRELAGVAAALEGAPELADYKRRSAAKYSERCRTILQPFVGDGALTTAALTTILGAADALSAAAASGSLSREDACEELAATIESTVTRLRR